MDSMSDINSKGMKKEWITPIIDKMTECSQHVFQILSKFPVGYKSFRFPKNVWLGTSITRTGEIYRVHQLREVANGNLCFVSIEPIQERIKHWFTKNEIDWIIVGLETGHRKNKILPDKEWIDSLIQNARAEGIPIFVKDNIQKLFGPDYHIEEFPSFLGEK
jgi:protein gp37